ncbi:MAG: hypothetical protein QM813_09515 [Verrucomicrobiota bacterium]
MKTTEAQIEALLRRAPRPTAPAGLKDKLIGQIQDPQTTTASLQGGSSFQTQTWWKRWWPALAPAGASLAFAAVIAMQQKEVTTLQETVRELNATISATTNVTPEKPHSLLAANTVSSTASEADELARLQQRVAALTTEIGQLEALSKANDGLRLQLAASSGLNQQELDALSEAKNRAQTVACINNLKQVGLAVRIWMMEHQQVTAPDFLSMSNELSTPKILFCPGNTNQPSVKTWAEFATTASSYQYLAAGVTNADHEPQRILTYCPAHNIFGLCDGSVQNFSTRRYEDCVTERDGKFFLELKATFSPAQP